MLPFKRTVCVIVILMSAGCSRDATTASPDAVAGPEGPSAAPSAPSPSGADLAGPIGGDSTIPKTAAEPTRDAASEMLSDAQIAAVTETANDGEIAQAKVAQGKARNARVKAFAAKMIAHHGMAKDKQGKLGIAPAESALSKTMKDDGAATLASLNASPAGAAFDETYMKAQVDGHQKVLAAIDQRLLPSVKNEKLAMYVKDIRPTVEGHLKDAREIEQSLSGGKPTVAAAGGTP